MVLGLKTTSFTYYYNIFTDMLKSDKSYDSLPNFSAADGESLNYSSIVECALVLTQVFDCLELEETNTSI